jgi:hypothetical protein
MLKALRDRDNRERDPKSLLGRARLSGKGRRLPARVRRPLVNARTLGVRSARHECGSKDE